MEYLNNRKVVHSKRFISLMLFFAIVFNFFIPALHVHAEENPSTVNSSCCQDNKHFHEDTAHEHHDENHCLLCQHSFYNFCDKTDSNLECSVILVSDKYYTEAINSFYNYYLLTTLQPQAP